MICLFIYIYKFKFSCDDSLGWNGLHLWQFLIIGASHLQPPARTILEPPAITMRGASGAACQSIAHSWAHVVEALVIARLRIVRTSRASEKFSLEKNVCVCVQCHVCLSNNLACVWGTLCYSNVRTCNLPNQLRLPDGIIQSTTDLSLWQSWLSLSMSHAHQ